MRLLSCALLASSMIAAVGCGASDSQLRTRAATDLNCQIREQTLVKIDARTRVITGCGQKATYVEDCAPQAWSFSPCTWRLDSRTDGDGQADSRASEASHASAPSAESTTYADRTTLPNQAVGFEFGTGVDAARAACESAEGSWQARGRYFSCSKTPVETGLPLRSRLGFCGGLLCEIILEGEQTPDAEIADADFQKLKNSMLAKYGPAQRIEAPEAPQCSAKPVSCVREENGHFAAVWKYEAGELIEVNLSSNNHSPRLAIRYRMMTQGMTMDEVPSGEDAGGVDTSGF